MSKRTEVNELIRQMDADEKSPTDQKLLHLAKVQTQLLADLLDQQIEANKKLDGIEIGMST